MMATCRLALLVLAQLVLFAALRAHARVWLSQSGLFSLAYMYHLAIFVKMEIAIFVNIHLAIFVNIHLAIFGKIEINI